MRPLTFRPPARRRGRPNAAAMVDTICWLTCWLTLWVAVSGWPCAQAQSISQRLSGSADLPWQISADTVAYDAAATTYRAEGNVVIEKQATRLVADAVAFNHAAMTAMASGNVVVTVGNDILTGDRVELDLARETGVVHHGSVFLHDNHFYIRGERIEKTGRDTYQARQAAITSCDGDQPDWIIDCRSVRVTVEGYGRGTHATFKVRDVPVLYTPYIMFPAKTRRQSGLLLPYVGASDRWGFFWDQPFFWAIGDSSDATLYTHYMAKRGTKVGLEYRYAWSDSAYGVFMADGLEDRQVDDGTPESTLRWGYAGDGYDRPNTDRYWVRAKVDQPLAWNARAKLDLDVVSDQDYLVEFWTGRSGFNNTRNYFVENFGRDINTFDDNIRTNRLNINRLWSKFSLNGDLLWYDDVTQRRWEALDDTLQRLPLISFNGVKQRIFGSDAYWDLKSEYSYFYREDGDRGHRADLYPRAYLPLRWKNYLSIEPSAGWRQTAWQMDRWEDDTLERSTYRQIFDARLDLSTNFSKVMDSPIAAADRIRHSIKPRIVYSYIDAQDQSDLPRFTELDRIEKANIVTYSLSNTFTARTTKRSQPMPSPQREVATTLRRDADVSPSVDPATPGDFIYDRFCRFYLEQSYDIEAAVDNDPEPFSEIYGELDFSFSRYLEFDASTRFNVYDSRFRVHNVGAVITDHRGDRLRVRHSYERNTKESILGTLSVNLTRNLSLRGEYERNLLAGFDISKGIGVLYTAQCWSVDLFYGQEGLNDKFAIYVNLRGIGGFGQ